MARVKQASEIEMAFILEQLAPQNPDDRPDAAGDLWSHRSYNPVTSVASAPAYNLPVRSTTSPKEHSMKQLLFLTTAAVAMPVLHGFCCADDKREEKRRFKGVELYSWRDKEGGWVFVLVNGTNRLKTEKEVKGAKDLIRGTEALQKALARLAIGEHVAWAHRIKGFEFPPNATRKEIETAAKTAKIELQTSAQSD
jgi:hypothetical protein